MYCVYAVVQYYMMFFMYVDVCTCVHLLYVHIYIVTYLQFVYIHYSRKWFPAFICSICTYTYIQTYVLDMSVCRSTVHGVVHMYVQYVSLLTAQYLLTVTIER